jgi:hypothetical protein
MGACFIAFAPNGPASCRSPAQFWTPGAKCAEPTRQVAAVLDQIHGMDVLALFDHKLVFSSIPITIPIQLRGATSKSHLYPAWQPANLSLVHRLFLVTSRRFEQVMTFMSVTWLTLAWQHASICIVASLILLPTTYTSPFGAQYKSLNNHVTMSQHSALV